MPEQSQHSCLEEFSILLHLCLVVPIFLVLIILSWLVNIGGWQVMGIVPSVLFLQLFSKSKMSQKEKLKKQKTTKSINCFDM